MMNSELAISAGGGGHASVSSGAHSSVTSSAHVSEAPASVSEHVSTPAPVIVPHTVTTSTGASSGSSGDGSDDISGWELTGILLGAVIVVIGIISLVRWKVRK
jgi:hypothetical protein